MESDWPRTGGAPVWQDLGEDPPGGILGRGSLLVPEGVGGRAFPSGGGPGGVGVEIGADEARERAGRVRAAGAVRPLLVEVSADGPPPAQFLMPRRLREGRTTAGAIRLGGEAEGVGVLEGSTPASRPGSPEPSRPPEFLLLRGETGLADTLSPRPVDDAAGLEYPFLITPSRGGWIRWEVEDPAPSSPSTERSTERTPIEWWGWVEEARPLRILALSGPPGSEFRTTVRALEERGETVESWIHLGRDLWVGRDRGGLPDGETAEASYREFDVILLFPGLELTGAPAEALRGAVARGGRGLALAGGATLEGWYPDEPSDRAPDSALPTGDPSEPLGSPTPRSVPISGLNWDRLPFEVPGLPPVDLDVWIRGTPGNPVHFEEFGRGRVVESRILDGWRVRMEAGAETAHRDHWGGIVDWLSDGVGPHPVLEILGASLNPGDPMRIRWSSASAPEVGEGIRLTLPPGPDGSMRTETLPVEHAEETPLGWVAETARPVGEAGGYRVEPDRSGSVDGPVGEFRDAALDVPSTHPGAWTRLSPAGPGGMQGTDPDGALGRIALASPGGRVLSPTGFRGDVAVHRAGSLRGWLPAVLFLLLAGLAGGDWALRRLSGRA